MKTICLLLGTATLAFGYIQNTDGKGGMLHRTTDAGNIQMLLNNNAAAGLVNAQGQLWITSGSNAALAISSALGTWNSVRGSSIHYAPLTSTALLDGTACTVGQSCSNVIAFDDTAENRQALGIVNGASGAIAITINSFPDDGSGTILKSDIIFNPTFQFSTNQAPNTYDLQSIVTHELGHTLGSSHSGVLSATMYWSTELGQIDYALPQPDDIAFLAAVYPNGGKYGTVTGKVQDSNGRFLRGALISLQDPKGGAIVGGFSSIVDGTFSFIAPAGAYQIWAEPLGGQIQPANVYLTAGQVDEDFQPSTPSGPVTVTAGGSTSVTITAPAGASPYQITSSGWAAEDSIKLSVGPGSTDVPSNGTSDFYIVVTGLGGTVLTDANISFLGPVTLQAGSVKALEPVNGGELYVMTITVPALSARTAATLQINAGGNTATLSGGMILLPPAPSFPSNGVVSVFYESGSPVGAVAPGELISIYGTNLGPTAGAGGTFDSGGNLATFVGGVEVSFDGQAVPILFSSPGQINLEVPFEVAGKSSTNIVVDNGVMSSAISVPVQNTVPALYPFGAVNYPSYKLNTAANPAAAGSLVILYAVGLGEFKTAVATGAAVTGAPVASNPVTVLFGSLQPVKPGYAGGTPGYTGLQQVNVEVPTGLPSGQVMVTISQNGQTSNAIPVYVQ